MNYKIFVLVVILSFTASGVSAADKQSALLKLVKENNTINIVVNSGDQAMNAVGVVINYDPSKVTIKGLDFSDSFCELFVEKIIDSQKGQIRILCGKPNPGFFGQGSVARLTIKKISFLSSSFDFDQETQVLANDGYGTDVLGSVSGIKASE